MLSHVTTCILSRRSIRLAEEPVHTLSGDGLRRLTRALCRRSSGETGDRDIHTYEGELSRLLKHGTKNREYNY